MSRRERNNEKGSKEEGGGGGGGASKFWKVAGAAAAAVEAGGSGGAAHTNEGAAAVWTKPKMGWVKLNVDGSLLREIPSPAGGGGVLRDDSGKWLYGFAQKLSPSLKEDETEKEAILKGLQWAHGKGVRKLVVESDNEGIVNKVNSGTKSTDPLILATRELLNNRSLWQQAATSTWIPGDANQVADKLTDIARSFTSFDLKETDSPPQNSLTALEGGGGGGWASMLSKIAGAAVATGVLGPVATGVVGVAGELYSVLKQPETEQVAVGSVGVHTDQEGAVWTKPMVGCWVKLNVDGSLLLPIPSAGCGGVLRDLSGKWMDGFAQKLSPSLKVDETEKKGILKGLQRAKGRKGVKKLVWWSLIMLGLRMR